MGNLSSCCMPGDKPGDEHDETDRLLQNPAEAINDGNSINGTLISHRDSSYGTTETSGAKQEANAWNRTLNKMATNVIDVSTLEAPTNSIEQSDWIDRQRQYTTKINQSRVSSILKSQSSKQKQQGKTAATTSGAEPSAAGGDYRRLANGPLPEPISASDLALINEFSDKSLNAVKGGFVVSTNEDLVVNFNP